ncbi:MAG TPA: efflux RND transporter periplasmic adaptor subunit [Vicinamibacterales bacterium]|jgi:HlyD family secretion protein
MKKLLLIVTALAIIAAGVGAYYRYREAGPEPTVTTAAVSRGDIVDTVGATGTVQAVTTVQVGTQVSGTIQALHADFNSLVRKGQVIARLDPSLFETQIEQARANLIRAQAELERLKVTLDDARTKLKRAQELWAKKLIPQSELETADVTMRSTEAQIRSSQAQVTQAEAALNQNQVNLQHTVIEAPIDGLVISRNVDVGQTVAASMQAPTLFVLAADLTKMQVVANLDESDVGRIRPGQRVSFRVDAYPTEDFVGTVSQVRLQPIVQQNVVTYATVIDVPNPELKLKPGMTATVNVEIARRTNVLRVPNAALRFRPTTEIYAALGQTPPAPDRGQNAGRGSESGNTPPAPTSAAPQQPAPAKPSLSGGNGEDRGYAGNAARGDASGQVSERGFGDGAGRGRLAERLQGLPPDERERLLERLRARGFNPEERSAPEGSGGRRGAAGPRANGNSPAGMQSLAARNPQATTIDALFGPLPPVETVGRVWIFTNKELRPIRVRLGISDGQATELLEGNIELGTELVTNVNLGTTETRPSTGVGPLFQQPGRGGFPAGGFPGGGGGRGGSGRGF